MVGYHKAVVIYVLSFWGAAVLFVTHQHKIVSVYTSSSGAREGRSATVKAGPFYTELNKTHVFAAARDADDSTPEGNSFNETTGENAPEEVVDDWPALDSLIGDMNASIKSDVQFVLDFAIVAHPKTATTSTMNWLHAHPEIQMHNHELCSLATGRPAELVKQLYDLKPGRNYKRGYKAPRDLVDGPALALIAQYWPDTKLIVGIRHPVLWFESFYNFRVQKGYTMPPAETLTGKLKANMFGVSTEEAKFHLHLDNLGKTARSLKERELLSSGRDAHPPAMLKMRNPVFLYEINQLHDTNQSRVDVYRSDLKTFLGLQIDLVRMPKSSGRAYVKKAIDICDAKYRLVRAELMKHAREASAWIQTYFLQSRDVTVSSPEYFRLLLESWTVDPCTVRAALAG